MGDAQLDGQPFGGEFVMNVTRRLKTVLTSEENFAVREKLSLSSCDFHDLTVLLHSSQGLYQLENS